MVIRYNWPSPSNVTWNCRIWRWEFLCFITNSIEVLLVSRFIQAFGASAGSVVTQTILRESVEGHKRHVMFAQISAVIAFTPAIGPLIGGFLDQMFDLKSYF